MSSPPPPPPPRQSVETTTPAAVPAFAYFKENYGYYTDDGMSYFRKEGDYETNPVMVAKLVERSAPILTTEGEVSVFKIQQEQLQRRRAQMPNPWA